MAACRCDVFGPCPAFAAARFGFAVTVSLGRGAFASCSECVSVFAACPAAFFAAGFMAITATGFLFGVFGMLRVFGVFGVFRVVRVFRVFRMFRGFLVFGPFWMFWVFWVLGVFQTFRVFWVFGVFRTRGGADALFGRVAVGRFFAFSWAAAFPAPFAVLAFVPFAVRRAAFAAAFPGPAGFALAFTSGFGGRGGPAFFRRL
jgi:hypothetical protein